MTAAGCNPAGTGRFEAGATGLEPARGTQASFAATEQAPQLGAAGAGAPGPELPLPAAPEPEGDCGAVVDSTSRGRPLEPSRRGPWPVGQRTVRIGRLERVEIYYPGAQGSAAGYAVVHHDLRDWLPDAVAADLPPMPMPAAEFDTYRDLPIAEGRFPVVLHVHSFGQPRIAFASLLEHWASRGFVVVAADHPGLHLGDVLAQGCGDGAGVLDAELDLADELGALAAARDELGFLFGHIDLSRLGLTGHGAGAFIAASALSTIPARVAVLLSGTHPVAEHSALRSVLYVGGMEDHSLAYAPSVEPLAPGDASLFFPGSVVEAFEASPGAPQLRKRLLGIADAGHLAPSDLCRAMDAGVDPAAALCAIEQCGAEQLQLLLGECGDSDPREAFELTRALSTITLEEELHCQDHRDTMADLAARHPALGELREDL